MAAARDVVLMTTHDIGRHLHCYGRSSVVSPNVDSLAASGARFAQAFCTAPQCSPSRASLASGRYPHNNGVMGLAHPGFDWELGPNIPHTAAILAGQGFVAHLFGGQHVSLHPARLGFARHHADMTGSAIASEVEEVLGRNHDRRFYLEINFEETHRPYPKVEGGPPDAIDIPPYLPDGPEAVAEIAGLQTGIRLMDEAAGRVLAALDKAGRADEALVIFTTDHGVAMPRAKCTLYDPGLEVSLLMRWPAGGLEAGAVLPQLVSNIDVLPTVLDAAGVEHPGNIQGRSLLSLLRGEAYEPREMIFAEKTFHSYYDPMRCVRTHRYKFIRNFESAFAVEVPGDIQAGPIFRADPSRYSKDRANVVELFDLESDPLEQNNLAGMAEIAAVEKQLSEELWRWMRETRDPLLDGPVPSPRYRLAMQS
ncbi:MAG: sulfatase [Chloroflexi bacterium]|nr:MAG: sulfatase [Chloroflexota bacterium]